MLMEDFGSLHYNSISVWLKNRFGGRVVKLALDGGFTCPNRDGKCGTGGCIYCSARGSGDFAAPVDSMAAQAAALVRKWPDIESAPKFIAYFQNNTGTYAPVPKLRRLWDEALSFENMEGLAIATRPDCLSEEILDLLSEYNEKTFLWVELGLQTASDITAELINRCYPTSVFEDAIRKLKERGIRTVVHLILGLPGEDRKQMLDSAAFVSSFEPFGIKLHMLHVMKNTKLGDIYERQLAEDLSDGFPRIDLLSFDEYINLTVDILERMPQSVTVHRLTGDAPGSLLIAPQWTLNKHRVLNAIQHEFRVRGTYQGSAL